jgi:hypothetical protein
MAIDDTAPDGLGQANVTLDRLAQALDCPIEVFSGLVPHDLHETNELLSLWLAIESPQGRATVLSVLRAEVAKAIPVSGYDIRQSSSPLTLAHATQKPDQDP